MKTNVRIFIATLAAGAFMCLFQGCIKDHFPQEEPAGGSVPVLMNVGTRAGIQDEEVVSLRVYAYSGGTLVGDYYTDSPGFVSGKATLMMDIRQVAASPQRTTFLIIANETSAVGLADASGSPASFADAPSEDYLKGLRFTGITGRVPMSEMRTVDIDLDTTVPNTAPGHEGHQVATQKIDLTLARTVGKVEFLFSRSPGNDRQIAVTSIEYAAGSKAVLGWLFPKTSEELKVSLASAGSWGTTAGVFFAGNLKIEKNTTVLGSQNVDEYVSAGSGDYPVENPYGSASPDEAGAGVNDAAGAVRGTNFKVTYVIDGESVEKTVWLPALERNKVYRVFCEVDRLTLTGSYTVEDWDDVGVSISAPEVKFLQVSKENVEMRNVSTDNSVVFNSSSDVTVTVKKAWYINKFGLEKPVTGLVTVSASGSSGRITINSPVPANNLVRYITLEVRNADGMTRTVNVIQYPLDWITFEVGRYSYRKDFVSGSGYGVITWDNPGDATISSGPDLSFPTTVNRSGESWTPANGTGGLFTSRVCLNRDPVDAAGNYNLTNYYYQRRDWNPGGFFTPGYWYGPYVRKTGSPDSENRNPRLYHIKITSTSGTYTLGIPGKDASGNTLADEYTKKMVSPSFMLASQLGVVTNSIATTVSHAAYHCSKYVEKTWDGVVYDDWRLPTEAELLIIKKYQNAAPQEAMSEVLGGAYYWSASGAVRINSGTGTFLRCIRDAY